MNNQFSVCTFNIGSGAGDYMQLCKHLNLPGLEFKNNEEQNVFLNKYENIQKKTAELVCDKAQAYCLQEVGDENRPLITSLKSRGFEIVRLSDNEIFDTAIALDKNRFKDITNHSIDVKITKNFKKDAAIAVATDIHTGEKFAFVSGHAPGFDFMKKTITEKDAVEGDIYCRAITEKLSEIGLGAIQVVGADLNANKEKWEGRFQIFSQEGFDLNGTNSSTNVNARDAKYKEREIDYIFTKGTTSMSIWQKMKSIFFSNVQFDSAAIKNVKPLAWNAEENCSDHLPVFVTFKRNTSIIQQIWENTTNFFGYYFGRARPQYQQIV